MITSLTTSIVRVTITWYTIGLLIMFLGDPAWAEAAYKRLSDIPGVPKFKMTGLSTALKVQVYLLLYWTGPMVLLWLSGIAGGAAFAKLQVFFRKKEIGEDLLPRGNFWGVTVPKYSIGRLPAATTPKLQGLPVKFSESALSIKSSDFNWVEVRGAIKEVVQQLTPPERKLSEELIQLLSAQPDHFAGLGHGVGLLEHTLNVLSEAAPKCSPDFSLPFIAALAHDIGKLITFQPDGKGGWIRKGLHSRECARILATLPAFTELPPLHQDALLLAVKYDHAPSKIPMLRGEKEPSLLALRIINALSTADRTATAGEKDRNLEKLNPEELLWLDFVKGLRDADVVQKGKKGASYQVNNPEGKFVYLYEAPWRETAMPRLPAEVAAALDLNRRDKGKLAKYTRILAKRLAEEGLLILEHPTTTVVDGVKTTTVQRVPEENPLWDIQSGSGESGPVIRGVMVLRADLLWKKLNYRIGVQSPYPVTILAPNADMTGKVNSAPSRPDEPGQLDVSTGMAVPNINESPELQAMVGFGSTSEKPKLRAKLQSAPQEPTPEIGIAPERDPAKQNSPVRKARIIDNNSSTKETPMDLMATLTSQNKKVAKASIEDQAEVEKEQKPVQTDSSSDALAIALTHLQVTQKQEHTSDGAFVVEGQPSKEKLIPKEPNAVSSLSGTNELNVQTPSPPKTNNESSPTVAPRNTQKIVKVISNPQEAGEDASETPTAENPLKLSKAEVGFGLAIADEAACLQYPHLTIGDKYYAIQVGEGQNSRKPGTKYEPKSKTRKNGPKPTNSNQGPNLPAPSTHTNDASTTPKKSAPAAAPPLKEEAFNQTQGATKQAGTLNITNHTVADGNHLKNPQQNAKSPATNLNKKIDADLGFEVNKMAQRTPRRNRYN